MEDVSLKSLSGLNILGGASSGASIGFSIGKQGMFLDPNIAKLFQEFTLFMQHQQRMQAIEEDITRALEKIINKFGKFEGYNITKFLEVYTCEMEVYKIPETKMISNFHLAIVPGIHEKVKKILRRGVETWSKFQEFLKIDFIDEDEGRITKRKFLDWVCMQPGMHMDLYEFMEEFERRFYQLSSSEKRSLGATKVELFLDGLDDASGDEIFMLIVDESTKSGCTNDWGKLKEAVDFLVKEQQAQTKGVAILSYNKSGEGKKDETLFSSSNEVMKNELEALKKIMGWSNSIDSTKIKDLLDDKVVVDKLDIGKNKESFQTIILENQGIQKFEGNMEFKDLDINDNEVENYGYSTLNKFVQVGDSNLDGSFLGDQKAISTFKRGEDVLSNTLDYVEEVKDELSQEMDYGSIQGDDDLQECVQEDMRNVIKNYMANEDYGSKDNNAKSLAMIKAIVNTSLLDQNQGNMDNAYVIEAQLGCNKDKIHHQAWDSRIENLKSFKYKDMDNGFKDYMDILNGAWNEKNKKKVAIKMYMAIQERIQLNLFISNFIPRQWFGHVQKRMFPIYLHMLHTWEYWHMPEDVQVQRGWMSCCDTTIW